MPIWRRLREIVEAAAFETADADQFGGARPGATVAVRLFDAACNRAPASTAPDSFETGAAFTMAVVALSAKMARADGVVLPLEIDCFDRIFDIPDSERRNIKRLFDLAAGDTAGFESYASQIKRTLDDNPMLLRQVLECLFHIASADRAIHPSEMHFLEVVAGRFDMLDSTFRHIRAQFVADTASPYDVLGLDPAATNHDLKVRYRKLVRENHPDLVIGRGLPADVVAIANRKLAAITDAYATLTRERGF